MNTRFVAVWSLKRGTIDPPEPLDDANQWRAFRAWRQETSCDVRVAFDLHPNDVDLSSGPPGKLGELVVWANPVARANSSARERRRP